MSASSMVIAGVCGLTACGVHPPDRAMSIDVRMTEDASSALVVRCVAKNVSSRTVYVLDSSRMPYILDDNGTLIVLHGVSPPPDDRELNTIEIPATWPLGAGESFAFDVALAPLHLRDHYGDAPPGPRRHGPARVVCRLGFGTTPIGMRAHWTIHGVLAWQALASSRSVIVQLPENEPSSRHGQFRPQPSAARPGWDHAGDNLEQMP